MRTTLVSYCAILIALIALPVRAVPHRISGDTSITVPPGQAPILDRVLGIAKDNHIPLGVVVNDDRLCEETLALDGVTTLRLDALIQVINNRLSGYHLELEDGVVVLEPDHPLDNIDQLLKTNIPYFRPEPSAMSELGLYLWVYVRAAIRPSEGSILDIISNPDNVVIQGFRVDRPASVREILNLIVQQSAGGIWVLAGLSKEWKTNLTSNPVIIASYADDKQVLPHAGCSAVMSRIRRVSPR